MFEPLYEFWYRVRSRFVRDELDADLAQELRVHAELLEAEARATGASPIEARHAAALRLGNITNIREVTRERWSFGWLDSLLQDTRYATRFLRRSPGFTAVAVLSLTLGVGANATVFAVADRLMFSAPPYVVNANQLFQISVKRETESLGDATFENTTGFDEYYALRDQARSFSSIALYTTPGRAKLGRGPDAPLIRSSMATANFFDVLGVQPVRGRFLLPDDEKASSSEYATVISYEYWQSHFGGADSVVGARFVADNLPFVVVGVAPRGFSGVELDAADVWTPLGALAPRVIGTDWKVQRGYNSRVLVRLHDGVRPATASTEASVILNRTHDFFEARSKTLKTALLGSIISARGPATQSGEVQLSTKLVVASALVLLAACANLANLLLVRALTRRREIALRMAIGVSRARLASQMLIESLIIAALGSAIALVVARWSGEALRTLVFPELQWASTAVSLHVFLYAVACGTLVAVLATLIPAIRLTRSDVSAALRSVAPQLTRATGNVRRVLLAAQVALAVLLIVGATAFSRSLNRAYEFNMGLDVDRLITARFWVQDDSLSDPS
ncbi:MAG: ABC transporter permease, partial [Gemmatimonas sp.]